MIGCDPMPNVAPEATHFINPELDDVPKQHVTFKGIGIINKPKIAVVGYHHKRD